jgi:hypothetical protein
MTKATRRQSQEGFQYRRISRSRWAGVLLVALVRDGLAAHRGKLLRAWLGRHWLVVEPLPGYPELNPVEPLWASLKGTGLANLAGDTRFALQPGSRSARREAATGQSRWPLADANACRRQRCLSSPYRGDLPRGTP